MNKRAWLDCQPPGNGQRHQYNGWGNAGHAAGKVGSQIAGGTIVVLLAQVMVMLGEGVQLQAQQQCEQNKQRATESGPAGNQFASWLH